VLADQLMRSEPTFFALQPRLYFAQVQIWGESEAELLKSSESGAPGPRQQDACRPWELRSNTPRPSGHVPLGAMLSAPERTLLL
jgi:hypothetical protein